MTRTKKIALGMAISAFAVSAFGTSAANATETPAPITFDKGALKLAGSNSAIKIIDDDATPQPLVITATVCLDSVGGGGCPTVTGGGPAAVNGDFRITPAGFNFIPFTSEVSASPQVSATVDLIPQADIRGHLTTATGQVDTVSTNFTADITLSGAINGQCNVTPIPLALSTEKTTPFLGDRFDVPTLANPQNGVVVDSWATLPAAAGANPVACAVLNAFTDGPGGLALGDGIDPVLNVPVTPPPPSCPTTPSLCPSTGTPPVNNTNNKQKTKKPCKKKKGKGASSAAKGKNCGKKKKK